MRNGIQRLHPESLGSELGLYSHVTRSSATAGDLVVVAGMLPVDASGATVRGGIEEQTAAAFGNLLTALDAVGSDLDSVLSLRTFLIDRDDMAGFASARRSIFDAHLHDGAHPPSNTLLFVAGLLAPEHRIEVEALAVAP